MANNDREVEIKVSLSRDEYDKTFEKLNKIAKFDKKIVHEDEYFDMPYKSFLSYEYPFLWLSIRKRGDKNILNHKKLYPNNSPEFTHSDEFETQITEPEKLKKIFFSIGFKSLVLVKKTRETYIYKDEFEIALDFIEELGYFIEIEAICDFGSVEETRKRIFEFAKILEIDINNKQNRGYPYLLMKKKGLIK